MNFQHFYKQTENFKRRIIEAFNLKNDQDLIIWHRKQVIQWIRKKQQDLQNLKKTKQADSFLKNLLKKTQKQQQKKKLQKQIFLHQELKNYMNSKSVDELKNIRQNINDDFFQDIKDHLQIILQKQLKQYYGYVKAPLIGNMIIQKKQDFKNCVQKSPNHNLKFIVTEAKVAHKYQRNLVQQVFGRVIRKKGTLSLMIKIQVSINPDERDIDLYCYIQDLSFKGEQYKQLKDVQSTQKSDNQYIFQIKNNNKNIQITKQSILQIFLAQMIVIPVQTLVSDFIIEINKDTADIIKYHQGTREQIGQSALLKDHPSIRNPLFYFKDYILKNQIKIQQILKWNTKKIYANFYCSLNWIAKLMINDFSFYLEQKRINSLCFTMKTFLNLWQVIHNLVMISDWVVEVISPIKSTVTIFQIINRFCPILGQMVNFQGRSFQNYRNHLLNLEADTFMTSYVPKNFIEQYKDLYISLHNYDDPNTYKNAHEVYQKIFAPIMDEFDLSSCDIYEAIYFLNFVAENKLIQFNDKLDKIPESWKKYKIWKKIYRLKDSQYLPYVNMYLDIFSFYMGIDPVQITNFPFHTLKNQHQNQQFLADLEKFINWMKNNIQNKYHNHLSILFQKAYRFKKYKICQLLLNYDILMNQFSQIFEFDEILSFQEQTLKEDLSQKMKKKSPQMHRNLKWQQLLRKKLKEKHQNTTLIKTIKYGQIYINKQIWQAMQLGQIQNNISRKDYMFDPERSMIKVNFSEEDEGYLQYISYPLVRYFYKIFLQKINKVHLIPNFTSLLNQKNMMLHLIQSIKAGLNFQKGFHTFSQSDLKNLLDKDQLSQAIMISIILMPSKILLRNIFVVPSNSPQNSIFMIDLKQFYRSNPIQKNDGTYLLKAVNCLFTFDQMNKALSLSLVKKYSSIQIIPFVESLFLQLSKLIKNINSMKSNSNEKNKDQLLGLIFQKDFIINLTQRMFKIRRCFIESLEKNKSISPMDVLNIIYPQLSYFYSEIIRSSPSLIQRQKNLLDQNWRKAFVIRNNLIQFFSTSSIIPQPLNIFPHYYRKLCFDGPTQNLNTLYNNSKKFIIYENNFQKINSFHHETFEYYVRNLDFSKLSLQEKKSAVQKLQQKSKQYLTKKGCLPLNIIKLQQIDITKATQLDFAYERLKQVILQNVKTTDLELSLVLKLLQSVIILKLKSLSGISSLGQSSYLSFSLQLRNLRILNIIQCHELKTIDIKCDALQNVTIRDNQSLQTIFINSFCLKNLDCTGSNKIKLENIGIYILKGLNVLLTDIACDGYLKKLKVDNYSTFVLNILKFLLNRLKQSQIKTIILITLTKLKHLQQQITAAFMGVPSISKVSNLILNMTSLQKKVSFKLIDLLFNNEMIDTFAVTDMSLTNIQQISLYMKQNMKAFKNTFKQTKINQTIKNSFQHFQTIFKFLNLSKHFKLHLDSLQLNADDQAMQIIDLLINKRLDLQKIDLIIYHCKVSTNLFQVIFQRKNVVSLEITQSIINNGICNSKSLQNLRQLNLKNTSINNFELLTRLDHLTVLKIDNCQLPYQSSHFYNSIGQKKYLKIFEFTNQKPINNQLFINQLFQNLTKLNNLQILNISNNYFNQNQLTLLNEFLKQSNQNISQLIIQNFYKQDIKPDYFINFLRESRLKSLQIQFHLYDEQILNIFLSSLSEQESILKLYLKTQSQVSSQLFTPLNMNKTLKSVSSNQLIPTWLKKHIKNNTKQRSKIKSKSKNDNIRGQFQIVMGNNNKFYDYHKLGLSMDGGGVRGLLLATQLQYLAKQVGYPLHKIFDVIGGTSIGGILALSISSTIDNTHAIMTPTQLKQIFTIHGKQIFKKSQIRQLASLYDTKYNPLYLQNLLNTYFKDSKLSDTLKQTNCIVTAVSRINNKDVIFKSTDAILNRDKDFYVKDIARATSAAPTYFPSAQIKNLIASQKYSLVDGGMGMNNPSKLVIDEVKKMAFNSHNQNNYFLLSLGTGRLPSQNIPEYAGIKDLVPIIDSFTESAGYFTQRDLNQNYKGHFMRVSPLINLTKKQGQLDSTQTHILKTYQDTGLSAAKDCFSNTIIFGKYRTQNLVEWLRQNTQRKYDI